MSTRYSSGYLSRGVLVAAACAVLVGVPDSADAQDNRRGFYVGLQLGVVNASAVGSSLSGVNHPTRCDVLLYPSSVTPPVDDLVCLESMPTVMLTNESITAAVWPVASRPGTSAKPYGVPALSI